MSNQSDLDPRNKEAIQAALEGFWDKAVSLNTILVEEYPEDSDILNRLGKAYSELGQVNKAKATFEKVLEEDPYNPIATKNLERLSSLRGTGIKPKEAGSKPLNPDIFIEELGKTKTIEVLDLAMPKVLIQLRVGDEVKLNNTKDAVTIISEDGKRLGKLNPFWGKEISQAMELNSEFTAIVKSTVVGKDQKSSSLSVFLREMKHSPRLVHPVFPIENNNFTPFVREETISYLKDTEPHKSESDETSEEVEDIPLDENGNPQEEETSHPPSDIIEDEEDFSPK